MVESDVEPLLPVELHVDRQHHGAAARGARRGTARRTPEPPDLRSRRRPARPTHTRHQGEHRSPRHHTGRCLGDRCQTLQPPRTQGRGRPVPPPHREIARRPPRPHPSRRAVSSTRRNWFTTRLATPLSPVSCALSRRTGAAGPGVLGETGSRGVSPAAQPTARQRPAGHVDVPRVRDYLAVQFPPA